MSQFTKKAIIDCTFELAEKKPFTKIKVRDIVDGCGITRNTFYYYFHDIYDVVDCFLTDLIEQTRKKESENPDESVFDFIQSIVPLKKVLINLYKSIGYDQLYRYCMEKCHGLVDDYVRIIASSMHMAEESRDLEILEAFYEEALFGILLRWLRSEFPSSQDELEYTLSRIHQLFDGQLHHVLTNIQKEEPKL